MNLIMQYPLSFSRKYCIHNPTLHSRVLKINQVVKKKRGIAICKPYGANSCLLAYMNMNATVRTGRAHPAVLWVCARSVRTEALIFICMCTRLPHLLGISWPFIMCSTNKTEIATERPTKSDVHTLAKA